MISCISSFAIISEVLDPNIFFSVAASVADAHAVNPNGIKRLLINGLITNHLLLILEEVYLEI